ncbi:hypothetical protein CDAR_457771 [Caerostris darwini]|uniref:MATH domain-containing protein n=1 Tax=Caerostris darwini TaxID=1538125 RepID=A0AAV4QXX3_9ARAC|nr:hypothetical protein CDAR_457771 [Caerostris darwini]
MTDSGETEKSGAFFLWKIENYSFGWNTAGNESSKKLDYSLSFLNANGLPEESLDTSGDFCRDCNGNRFYVALDELFIRRRNAFLPQDTLTIQCHVKRIN